MLKSFFPAAFWAGHQVSPWLLDKALPEHIAEKCPVVHITIANYPLRWPGLLLPAACGATIGFFGACSFFGKGTTHHRLWGYAFLWFGCMNVDAMFYHCVLEPGSQLHVVMWLCDCLFTGNSGMALTLAALHEYTRQSGSAPAVLNRFYRAAIFVEQRAFMWWILFLIAGMCSRLMMGWTAIGEWTYLVPGCSMPLAVISLLHIVEPVLVRGEMPSSALVLGMLAFVGVAVELALDEQVCDLLGPAFGNLGVATFVACDLAFLGIWAWISGTGKVSPD